MVVTGGLGPGMEGHVRVVRYNRQGDVTDLPELNTGRWSHACGFYINANNQKVCHSCSLRKFQ